MMADLEAEKDIDHLIQLELDALDIGNDLLSSDDDNDNDNNHGGVELEDEQEKEVDKSISEYLSHIMSYNIEAEKRMHDADTVLNEMENISLNTDIILKHKLCIELDDIPIEEVMEVRNKVLVDLEEQERKEGMTNMKDGHELAVDTNIITNNEVENIIIMEKKALDELQQMCREHELAAEKLRLINEKREEDTEIFHKQNREKHMVKIKEINDLQQILKEDKLITNYSQDEILNVEAKQLEVLENERNEKMDVICKDSMIEKERLISLQDEISKITNDRLNNAATVIQKYLKRYFVQKVYAVDIKRIKDNLILLRKQKMDDLIKQQEILSAELEQKRQDRLQFEENERKEKEKQTKEKDERRRIYEQQKSFVSQQCLKGKENKKNLENLDDQVDSHTSISKAVTSESITAIKINYGSKEVSFLNDTTGHKKEISSDDVKSFNLDPESGLVDSPTDQESSHKENVGNELKAKIYGDDGEQVIERSDHDPSSMKKISFTSDDDIPGAVLGKDCTIVHAILSESSLKEKTNFKNNEYEKENHQKVDVSNLVLQETNQVDSFINNKRYLDSETPVNKSNGLLDNLRNEGKCNINIIHHGNTTVDSCEARDVADDLILDENSNASKKVGINDLIHVTGAIEREDESSTNEVFNSCCQLVIMGIDNGNSEYLKLYKQWISQNQLGTKYKKVKVKSRRRRSMGKEQPPPITQQQMLDGCIGCKNLANVKAIELMNIEEEMSCSSLSQCFNLEYLRLSKCNLATFNGIDSCSMIKSLFILNSNLKNLNAKLDNICLLDLSNNNLSTLHGLEELPLLLSLNLAHNDIMRISDIQLCPNLLHLNLDNNKIISPKGIEYFNNLLHFSCKNNDISFFEEVKMLPYLQTLILSGNALSRLPGLLNNVLLRELRVENNSLSSINELSGFWLPLLNLLCVAGNCLREIPDLSNLLSLNHLNVNDNLLSDTNAVSTLKKCHNLKILTVKGNSLSSIEAYRRGIRKIIPQLRMIDGEYVGMEEVENQNCTCLKGLCQSHNARFKEIVVHLDTKCIHDGHDNQNTILELCELQCKCWKELHEESIKQLNEHRELYNNYEIPKKNEELSDKTQVNDTNTSKMNDTHTEKEILVGNECTEPKDDILHVNIEIKNMCVDKVELDDHLMQEPITKKHDIENAEPLQECSVSIENKSSYLHDYVTKPEDGPSLLKDMQNTQASVSDNSADSDYEYHSINLNEFELNESSMEWNVPNTPQFTFRGPPLGGSPFPIDDRLHVKDAWGTPENGTPVSLIPDSRSPSICSTEMNDLNATSASDSSFRKATSKKTEIINEEWGFQNEALAELMLKRAKKLGKGKKKKVNSAQRYELFKKAAESSQTSVVASGRKKGPERISYFQGSASPIPVDKSQQMDSQQMTYKWVCTQPVLHSDRALDVMSRNADFFSEVPTSMNENNKLTRYDSAPVLLPLLDSAVLAGKPLALVQSEIHNPKPPLSSRKLPGSGKSRKVKLEKQSHSAPSPEKRTDPSLTICSDMGEKWKNCAYR